jgi:hypothetical protein
MLKISKKGGAPQRAARGDRPQPVEGASAPVPKPQASALGPGGGAGEGIPVPVDFEITNRHAELAAAWLRERYTPEQLQAAFVELRRRGRQRLFPLNIARILGAKLPTLEELEAATPEAQARAEQAKAEALAKLAQLRDEIVAQHVTQ